MEFTKTDKFRQWELILYPENLIDDWEDKLPRLVQVPLAYILHDKDKYKVTGEDRDRKPHIHLWVVWNNTVCLDAVKKLVNKLSIDELHKCCSTGQPVLYPENAFLYLTHKDDKSKKKGKYLYSDDELILCNNFDLGDLIQISNSEKQDIKTQLAHEIVINNICDYSDFFLYVSDKYGDRSHFMYICQTEDKFLDRICTGQYKKWKRELEKNAKKAL